MIFQADVRKDALVNIRDAESQRAAREPDRLASWLYAREIVDGVASHQEEIDDLIASFSQGWSLERMPNIDRALLRVAAWEILHNPDVPAAVAIDEAVELAKEYSTEDSGRFVNGVLGRIAEYAGAGRK